MKVLAFFGYYKPEIFSSSYIVDNYIEAFLYSNFSVVIIAPTPTRGVNYSLRFFKKRLRYETSHEGQLCVYRFLLMKEGRSSLSRGFRYCLSCIMYFFYGLFLKNVSASDLLFVDSTPPILGAVGVLVKKIRRIPMVYNLQDIFPDSLVATGLTRKESLLWRIGRVIENFTYRNADKIIVISQDFKKNIMNKGVPESKIEVIYNWVDEKAVVPISRNDNKLFDELGLSRDLFYVVYAGNLGHAQNIELVIEAARNLMDYETIRFIVFGSGGLEKELKRKISNLKINNLLFFPIQNYDKTSEVYSIGNIAIVSCKQGLGTSAMPSKTWCIMSTGTAILANFDIDTELQNIIEGQKVGLFTEAGDIDKFVEAILYLYRNPNKCDEYGINGRNFILNNLTREIGTSKYVEVLESVIRNNNINK